MKNMQKTFGETRKVHILIILMLILCFSLSFVLVGQSDRLSQALTTAGLSSATSVGSGTELWDAANNGFNSNVLDDLIVKIFGDEEPDEYIDNHNYNDPHGYGSDVVQASYINANIHNGTSTINNNYGLVVTLGGMKWMITSITRDNDDNVVATLFLADNKAPSMAWGTNNSNLIQNGAYCVSGTRLTLTTGSTWSFFQAGDFAEQYLVQPKNINYQLYQNHNDCSGGLNYTLGNEALKTPKNTTKWPNSASYADTSSGPWQVNNWPTAQDYDAWGNDYIWLPSATEVGIKDYNKDDNIWGITNEQRSYSTSDYSWLRSVNYTYYYHICALLPSGSYGIRTVTVNTPSLRPAIHLNLTAAMGAAIPEDTEVTYTGSSLDIKTAATLAGASWYTDKLDTNIQNGNVKVAYTSGSLNADGYPQNAGTYGISFTIKELSADSPFIWKDDDRSDPKIATKTMTLTIKPAELRATWDYKQETDTEPIVTFTGLVGGETDSVLSLTKKYTGRNDTASPTDTSKMPLKIGDYTVTITDIGNPNYTLVSGNSYDFHMDSIKVALPTIKRSDGLTFSEISSFTNWYTYGGPTVYNIYDLNYNTDQIEITDFGGMQQVFGALDTLQAINAGTYTLTLSIKDKDNMVWADNTSSSADRTIEIKILPKEIVLEVYGTNNGVLTGSINQNMTSTFDLAGNVPVGSDTVSVQIKATYVTNPKMSVVLTEPFTITNSGVGGKDLFTLELATGQIYFASDWKLEFAVAENDNYEFKLLQEVTLRMTAQSTDGYMYWRLYIDGMYAEGQQIKISKDDTDVATYTDKLTYDGREYTFALNNVSLPSGWRVDTSYNDNGYTNGYKNKTATNAGDYETSVMLLDDEDKQHEYTIKWNIKKALIDLSNVRWSNDGKLEYNGGQTVYAEIDLSTLPKNSGLVPSYKYGAGANRVGEDGREEVTFTLDNNNYEIPTKGGKGVTYKFTENNGLTDFEWEKDFEVVPAEIDLTWTSVKVTDSNGVEFSVLVLKDYPDLTDSNAIVTYLYYETDSKYNPVSGVTPKTYDQIVVDATNRAYYKAYPVLNPSFADNYKLPFADGDSGLYSSGFVVGGGSNAASVDLNTTVYAYNGYGVTLDLKIEGQATKSDLNFTFYRNATESLLNKMTTSPIDVGAYLVVITTKSSSNVVLSGNTKFVFTIEPAVIAIDWNENAKPPVLNLLYGQINGVQYEIRDSNNNPVASFGTTTPTGTYGIRAKIKDGQENNFIFDNGKTATDWVEFTYTQGTTVYDPNSPDNPFYPQTPTEQPDAPSDDTPSNNLGDNNTTDAPDDTIADSTQEGDGNTGGGLNIDTTKIKDFFQDYWQPIVCGVAIILILAFTGKGISYASKRKKIKKEIKKKYTPAFVFALTAPAGEKLWSLDYQIWTILAFALIGVAVLSLIFMILEKHSYKKAQEELDEAKADYARNPMAYATAGVNARLHHRHTQKIAKQAERKTVK